MHLAQFLHAILHIDHSLDLFISHFGVLVYVTLFAIVFSEIGILPLFFLPGDPLLFVCGALSATGEMNVVILMIVFFVAASAGNMLSYWTGKSIGQKIWSKNYKWLNQAALKRTHAFYEKYGAVTLILSPFIAVVRTFALFIAGASEMTFARFHVFSLLGAAIWVIVLVPGGYFFGNIPLIHNHLNTIILLGVGLGIVALLVGGAGKILTRRVPGNKT